MLSFLIFYLLNSKIKFFLNKDKQNYYVKITIIFTIILLHIINF